MLKTIDCVQNTPEWFAAKLGVPSSSHFDEIITTKGMPSKQRTKYLYRLAGEIVSGKAEETYQSASMARGIEKEEEARDLYRIITNEEVNKVGFCTDRGYGASPDALVGKLGTLEIKCPTMAVHVGYLLANEFVMTYFQQCQGQLLVTGRKWCDFMSYYPGIKPLIIRIKADDSFIPSLKGELIEFCKDLKEIVKKIGD